MLKLLKSIIKCCIRFLPVKKNRVVFINFDGEAFGDNPKYICNELLKSSLHLDLIWLAKDLNIEVPDNVRIVKIYSLKGYIALSTAKVWVANTRLYKGIGKKHNQYYVQTWHASYALKKLEKDADSHLTKHYIKMAKYDGKITNLMISNSILQTKEFRNNFWYKGEILECGYPRNDILINKAGDSSYISLLKTQIGLKASAKIILYAPTFRGDNVFSQDCNLQLLYNDLYKYFDEECVLAVRLHPNVSENSRSIVFNNKIVNVTFYPDMQELLLISDALITDYSSSVFDFALLRKPIIIYATDIEEYSKMRGIKDIFYTLPFPNARNQSELLCSLQSLLNYDMEIYDRFFELYDSFDDGKGSQIVAKRIEMVIKSR